MSVLALGSACWFADAGQRLPGFIVGHDELNGIPHALIDAGTAEFIARPTYLVTTDPKGKIGFSDVNDDTFAEIAELLHTCQR